MENPKLEADPRTPVESKRTHREENVSVLPEGNEVMIRTIPPDIGRVKLEEVCAERVTSVDTYAVIGLFHSPWVCAPGAWRTVAKAKLLSGWLDQIPR